MKNIFSLVLFLTFVLFPSAVSAAPFEALVDKVDREANQLTVTVQGTQEQRMVEVGPYTVPAGAGILGELKAGDHVLVVGIHDKEKDMIQATFVEIKEKMQPVVEVAASEALES